MAKHLLTFLFLCCTFLCNTLSLHAETVNVPTAGTLQTALTSAGINTNTVTSLKITGYLSSSEFGELSILQRMTTQSLTYLDLSEASIEGNAIPDRAFTPMMDDYVNLKTIILPNSVKSIGSYAFASCSALMSITIPESISLIGDNAFTVTPCSVTVDAANTNYSSEDGVLYNKDKSILMHCPATKTSYVIPSSVTTIDQHAFDNCIALTSVTIPNSVTTIGNYAFTNCNALTSVTIPNSVTTIGPYAFEYCNKLTSVIIPNSVTTIEEAVFDACSSLTSVTIPNSVTTIRNAAFSNCISLTSVTIPNSVTTIEQRSFYNCYWLTSVNIPNSVTTIGAYAFYFFPASNSTFNVYRSNATGITNIVSWLPFTNSPSKQTLHVPVGSKDSYTTAGWESCFTIIADLPAVTLGLTPENVSLPCTGGSTSTVTVTSTMSWVAKIPSDVTWLTISAGSNTLTITAAANTSATTRTTTITVEDYDGATKLITVTQAGILPTVTTQGATSITTTGATLNGSINANNNSTTVTFEYGLDTSYGTTVTADQSPVTGTSATAVNYVLTGLTPNTTYHYRVIGISSGGTTNGADMSFTTTVANPVISVSDITAGGLAAAIAADGGDLAMVTSLTVTGTIDARDFKTMRDNMPLLATLNLSGATIAEYSGTDGTEGASSITYPTNEIPANAFENKISLTSIVMPASVTSIGSAAFSGCRGITGSLTIPSLVTSIGVSSFYKCSGFNGSLIIPSSVTSIGSSAFSGCSGFTGPLTIPASVTSIESATFSGCVGFTGPLTIPSSVTSIGYAAFQNCSNISSINAYGTTPGSITLGSSVFSGISTGISLHVKPGTKALYEVATQWKVFTIIEDLPIAPAATTTAASAITSVGATLNGSINANNASATVSFEYGLTTSYGTSVTADESPVTGSIATAVSKAITGLTPNTTYHYRVKGVNSEGTTNGTDLTFTSATNVPTESFYEQITLPFAPTDDVDMSSSTLAPKMNLASFGGGSYPSKGYKVTLLTSGTITLTASSSTITTSEFAFLVSTSPDASSNKYMKVGNGTTTGLTPGIYYIALLTDNKYGKFKLNIIHTILPVVTSVSPTGGPTAGGKSITITGTNFTGTTAVKFGTKAATSYTVNSDTQITATTPAGTGTVDVTVTTVGGTSATSGADQFTYVAEPTMTVISPINGPIAGGTSVVITGTNLTGAAAVKFGSTNATSFTVNSATQIIAVSPAGSAGAVDITVTTAGGTSATSSADQFTYVAAPTATTVAATSITSVGATLNGSINANNNSTTVTFEYGLDTSYGKSVTADPSTVTGTSATAVSYPLSGLTPNTTYHYRVVGANGGSTTNGDDLSFTTQYAPQTISFGALENKTYGDAAYNLAATSTSGLAVSFSSDNTAVARVSGSTIIIVGAGTANITASQAGNATYAAATNVTQQLTVNKKALTVTAVTDTKTYDGTTVSVAIPTVGTLATSDVINTAPTQAFDNASVGTTHVLTASGLTIKRASIDYAPAFDKTSVETIYKMHSPDVDVTGNYEISYTPATGTINKMAVTVTATADTKTYDGTTASAVAPTIGTLATGDAINVAPTQVFDNASVGTTHVLTASGLTIKNGTADATDNYDISYASATGTISARALTITTPAVTLSKVYDGNTVAAVTEGTLSGVLASDAGKVTVTASASYDNATIGTNKTITVVYTLGGSSAGNYSVPTNFVTSGAEISSGTITLQPLSNPTPSTTSTDLVLSYNVVTGGPTQYKITFEAAALAVGIQNVNYTALVTAETNGNITITLPKGTRPGHYKGTLQMKNDFGVESTVYNFVITVNIPTEYIAVKYNRVLVLDNSTRMFSAYQWYKDGVAIEGATQQFYSDPKGLVGTYSLKATTTDGEILYSDAKVLSIPLAVKVTAYPTMIKASQTCTVEITDEAMELDLTSAELSVYSSQGIRVYHSTKVEKLNTIKLPAINGVYSGRITAVDGQSFLFKVIVAN